MYKVLFARKGFTFGFSWTFETLAEAVKACKELKAAGHVVQIKRV